MKNKKPMLKLKAIREERKYSQKKFAEIIGVNTLTISAYEQGTRNPSYSILKKIAVALRCSIDDLI